MKRDAAESKKERDRDQAVRLTFVGDIMFDTRLLSPRTIYFQPATAISSGSNRRPSSSFFLNDERTKGWLKKAGVNVEGIDATSHSSISIPVLGEENLSRAHSFEKIKAELSQGIAVGNLECPLSSKGRRQRNDACYRAHPDYWKVLAEAGFQIISFSTNHSMDYGDEAFVETIEGLQAAGISVVGAFRDDRKRRRETVKVVNGIRLAFLAYNAIGPAESYASSEDCGLIPFNEMELRYDFEYVKEIADVVIVSVHWGIEQVRQATKQQVRMAHLCIDLGAALVVGHHSHVPGEIEQYKDGLILYSLGNCVFGHGHHYWHDNMLVHVDLTKAGWTAAEIVPIGTTAQEVFRPTPLKGNRARSLLTSVDESSSISMEIVGTPPRGRLRPHNEGIVASSSHDDQSIKSKDSDK